MVHALQAMVALLMSRDEPSSQNHGVDEITRRIKLFLTLFARCDQNFHTGVGTDLHAWVSAYNFTTLLNLPLVIERFGPLRDLWEGGYTGEGSVASIKPIVRTVGRIPNWTTIILKKIHQNTAMKEVRRTLTSTDEEDEYAKRKKENAFYCYTSCEKVKNDFNDRLPLSVVMYEGNFYMVVTKWDDRLRVVELTKQKMVGTKVGLVYFAWTNGLNAVSIPNKEESLSYCLFLPYPNISGVDWALENKEKPFAYTVITSDWKQLDKDGTFTMPETPGLKPDATRLPQAVGFLSKLESTDTTDKNDDSFDNLIPLSNKQGDIEEHSDSGSEDDEEDVVEAHIIDLMEADTDTEAEE